MDSDQYESCESAWAFVLMGLRGAEGVFFAGRAHSVGPRRVEGEVSGTGGNVCVNVKLNKEIRGEGGGGGGG